MDSDKQNVRNSEHELKVLVKALTKSVEYIHKKHLIMTGSTTRKPRLVGGDKGCNVSIASFPESPAPWAGSFTFIAGSAYAKKVNLNIRNLGKIYPRAQKGSLEVWVFF
jgi:hypothetical protein